MMADNWAYTAYGRLPNHDIWDWFGVASQGIDGQLFGASRKLLDMGLREPKHIIGFDGKNWQIVHHAYPKDFLDPVKFPAEKYNYEITGEKNGRPLDFYHGYQSESSAFPSHVPAIDAQETARLHEQNIIPLWEKSRVSEESKRPAPKTITSYESLNHSVPLSEYFPPEAIEALQKAHSEGRPIAIHCDPVTKKWDLLTEFHKTPKRASSPHVSHPPILPPTASQEAMQTGKGLAERFKDLKPTEKIAIVGGSVALATLVGYWVFKTMHQKNIQQSKSTSTQMQ